MKRIICILASFISIAFLCNCGRKTEFFAFQCQPCQVKEIKIVEWNNSLEDYVLLKDVDDEYFLDVCSDIQTIGYRELGPTPGSVSGKVILIMYESGECDVISRSGPTHFVYDEMNDHLISKTSYLRCQESEKYDQIIDKWLNS